jgi:hypothetical protein
VTTDTGGGRIHLYAGGDPMTSMGNSGPGATSLDTGETLTPAADLWADPMKMRGYDIVMYSCEGNELGMVKDPYLANLEDYANNGGRAFLTHYHYYWLSSGSAAFQSTADFSPGGQNPPNPSIGIINTGFAKGAALADWLMVVGGTTTRGELTIYQPRASVRTAVAPTEEWISIPVNPMDMDNPALQYMSFNTPVGVAAEEQCGRVVNTDVHIGAPVNDNGTMQGGDTSNPMTPYPGGCQATRIATSAVNARTEPSTATRSSPAVSGGSDRTSNGVPTAARAIPPAAPSPARSSCSTRIWRATRSRVPPSACRTAITPDRPAIRDRLRFATLTQATSSTSPTAPNNRNSRSRTPAVITS